MRPGTEWSTKAANATRYGAQHFTMTFPVESESATERFASASQIEKRRRAPDDPVAGDLKPALVCAPSFHFVQPVRSLASCRCAVLVGAPLSGRSRWVGASAGLPC